MVKTEWRLLIDKGGKPVRVYFLSCEPFTWDEPEDVQPNAFFSLKPITCKQIYMGISELTARGLGRAMDDFIDKNFSC